MRASPEVHLPRAPAQVRDLSVSRENTNLGVGEEIVWTSAAAEVLADLRVCQFEVYLGDTHGLATHIDQSKEMRPSGARLYLWAHELLEN